MSHIVDEGTCGFVEVECFFVIPWDDCSRLQIHRVQAACRIRRKLVPVFRSESMWFCRGRVLFLQFHGTIAVAYKFARHKPLVVLGGILSQFLDQRTCSFLEVECVSLQFHGTSAVAYTLRRHKPLVVSGGNVSQCID